MNANIVIGLWHILSALLPPCRSFYVRLPWKQELRQTNLSNTGWLDITGFNSTTYMDIRCSINRLDKRLTLQPKCPIRCYAEFCQLSSVTLAGSRAQGKTEPTKWSDHFLLDLLVTSPTKLVFCGFRNNDINRNQQFIHKFVTTLSQ